MNSKVIFHIAEFRELEFAFLAVEHLVHSIGVSATLFDHYIVAFVNDNSLFLRFLYLNGLLAQVEIIDISRPAHQ
jgi:hypothetical protein